MQIVLTPEILLAAYREGIFPMADSAHSNRIHWVCPEMRGQLSVSDMHIPRRLKRSVRKMKINGQPYEIRINHDFEYVINACGEEVENRPETWINKQIVNAYCTLHRRGFAHSVECWQGGHIVGGLYGLAIGGVFFGESMFCRARDASKVALVHLVARLSAAGYEILDTQFTNDHLTQFGVYELGHFDYMDALNQVIDKPCQFDTDLGTEQGLVLSYLS